MECGTNMVKFGGGKNQRQSSRESTAGSGKVAMVKFRGREILFTYSGVMADVGVQAKRSMNSLQRRRMR